jgi:hypothetical protein
MATRPPPPRTVPKTGSITHLKAHLRHSKADTTAKEDMQELPESVWADDRIERLLSDRLARHPVPSLISKFSGAGPGRITAV